ncbi:MerR family transcriptional regulator [Yinghuangia aomiensis]
MTTTTDAPLIVDTAAAAVFAGVKPVTIRSWIQRGKLTHHGHDRRGRTLVDLHEVDLIAPETASDAPERMSA